MNNLVRMILISLMMASTHSLILPRVQAGSGLTLHGGYPQTPPTIDGNIQTSEWSAAATAAFGPCTEGITGTLYIMNDAKYLYVAVSYDGDDDFSEEDGFDLVFDNDHGSETTIEEGDEILSVWGASRFQDEFWHYEKIGGYDWHAMIDTPEGYAAGNRQGTLNEFELSNPLNSGEIGKDFILSSGLTVGFAFRVNVDGFYGACGISEWNNPSVYANYVVASPAVLTPTVDMPAATTSITATIQTASAGRTTMEPVLESSISSSSILWGVVIGLFVSTPICVYRHMSYRRTTREMRTGRRMSSVMRGRWPKYSGFVSASGGVILASLTIITIIYLGTPSLAHEARAFVNDFYLVEIFQGFWWYVPSTNHPVVYVAAQQFCYAFGLVQIGILGLRFARGSSTRGKAKILSGIMFWIGAGYVFGLVSQGVLSWFSFIGCLIIMMGISIVTRGLVLVFVRRRAIT